MINSRFGAYSLVLHLREHLKLLTDYFLLNVGVTVFSIGSQLRFILGAKHAVPVLRLSFVI